MTYIAGWKYKGNVYLVSDTMITRESEVAVEAVSTVGQANLSTNTKSVNEECFKLFQIENDCIIAISGDVVNASEFVENIRAYSTKDDREELLEKFCNSARHKEFDAIIGISNPTGVKLFSFSGKKETFLVEKDSFVAKGSGLGALVTKTQQLIEAISKENYIPSERLAFFVSGHQLFSISEDIVTKGVGGIFNGVRISKTKVEWNADISYIFYSNQTTYNQRTKEIELSLIHI